MLKVFLSCLTNQKTFFCLFLAIIGLQLYVRYFGINYGYYLDFLPYMFNENVYTKDIFFQNNFFRDASILYDLVKLFHIHLDNDYVGFCVHILFSLISIFFVFLLLKKTNKVFSPLVYYLVILIVIFFDTNRLMYDAKPGLISSHTLIPAYFAHQLSFVFYYLLVQRRLFWANCLLTLILAFSTRGFLPLLAISFVYAFLIKAKLKNFLSILLPCVFLVYKKATNPIDLSIFSKEQLISLCESIYQRSFMEDAIHLQPVITLLGVILSFYVFYKLIKNFEEDSKRLLKSVLVVGIFTFVLGGIYTWKGYLYFPNPILVMLSPVRSMESYLFFFYLITGFVFLNSKLNNIYKLLFIVVVGWGIHLYRIPVSKYIIFVIISGIVVLLRNQTLLDNFLKALNSLMDKIIKIGGPIGNGLNKYGLQLLLCFLFIYSLYQVDRKQKVEQSRGKPFLNRWTEIGRFHEPFYESLTDIRSIKNDFVFIGFSYKNEVMKDGLSHNIVMNWAAMKSKYTSEIWNYMFDPELRVLQEERAEILNSFIEHVDAGKIIPDKIIDYFRLNDIYMLLPKRVLAQLPQAYILKVYRNELAFINFRN